MFKISLVQYFGGGWWWCANRLQCWSLMPKVRAFRTRSVLVSADISHFPKHWTRLFASFDLFAVFQARSKHIFKLSLFNEFTLPDFSREAFSRFNFFLLRCPIQWIILYHLVQKDFGFPNFWSKKFGNNQVKSGHYVVPSPPPNSNQLQCRSLMPKVRAFRTCSDLVSAR